MRVITATFLGFLMSAAACGPRMPDLGLSTGDPPLPGPARDAARSEAAAEPARDAGPRPDVAAPMDARPDVARPDAPAEGRERDAASEAQPDAAADARPDGPVEARPDAAADAAREAAPDVPGARAPRAGELRIDELLIDPDGSDLGHEWIELVNVAAEPLSLADLHVADAATDAAVDLSLSAGVIAPGARLVLGQSRDRDHNGGAPVDAVYGTRVSLNNDADRIAVCLGPCATGVTLDMFAWTSAFGADYAGHAVVVAPDGKSTCPASEPYGPAGDHGSPGRANPPCAAPDAAAPGS